MLIMIDGNNRTQHVQIMDEMYMSRANVFGARRGWDVAVTNDREIDIYDDLDPLYLVSVNSLSGLSTGSMRLLPTTSRNMTKEIFSKFFDDDIDIASPLIWECTRFCLHNKNGNSNLSLHQVSRTTSELLIGLCEIGLQSGINQIIAVVDEPMRKILRRARWQPEIIASTTRTGELIHAGLWDVSPEAAMTMREASGIDSDVFAQDVMPKVA